MGETLSSADGHTINTRTDLINEIRLAESKGLIEADELGMIEGVMQVDHLQARDIMLSRLTN